MTGLHGGRRTMGNPAYGYQYSKDTKASHYLAVGGLGNTLRFVFQSDSSPQFWYRWEVSCESWKYYNINMIYMCASWISSLCFFRIIFVSFEIHMIFWPYTRFYWFSLMIYWRRDAWMKSPLTLFCFFNHVKLIDSVLPQVYTVIYHSSRRQNVISALLKK